jgi:plastocyanin domain-containing protein
MKFAAITIIILALFNMNNALALVGEGVSFKTVNLNAFKGEPPVTEATITIGAQGYSPDYIVLKSNSHVTINLVNTSSFSCASAFTIPEFGIQKFVKMGTTEKVEFDTPNKPTQIAFMCSMGMYKGYFKVI